MYLSLERSGGALGYCYVVQLPHLVLAALLTISCLRIPKALSLKTHGLGRLSYFPPVLPPFIPNQYIRLLLSPSKPSRRTVPTGEALLGLK